MRLAGVLLLCVLLAAGCAVQEPPVPSPTASPTSTASPTPSPAPTPVLPPHVPAFDGEAAYRHVVAQSFHEDGTPRYRIPGTPGNDEVAAYIDATLSSLGWEVSYHWFNATYGCERTTMHNVVATRPGASGRVVAFGAHYDTRPVADKDPDPARRTQPVLGANDGASGVAVLLELARVLPPSDDEVRLVFFDGEDGGGYGGPGCTDWILGSRAYVGDLSREQIAAIRWFVLVDMVGDPDLLLPWEMHSRNQGGREIQDAVHATAHGLGHHQFVNRTGYAITDDHVPFLDEGIPAVDFIHTIPGDPRVFPRWHHTTDDDLDAVSADSLAAVGRTLETWFAERQPATTPRQP